MNDTGNVFDVSTTLMEIDDLPESESDTEPRPEDIAAEENETEPHYFSAEKPHKQVDVRRRAMTALGAVGGGVLLVTMVSAAVGMGNDQPGVERQSLPRAGQPLSESSGPVVQESRPQVSGQPSLDETPEPKVPARESRPSERHAREVRADARAHRRHSEHAKPAPPPEPEPEPSYSEPEPTYTPEPEPTYEPVETAPPPAPSPPSSSGGGGEFGIEP
jgi:hypothetical protein